MPRKSRSPSRPDRSAANVDPERRRDGSQGDAGAGRQGLEQHVARAGRHAVAAGGRVEARFDQRLARRDLAGDPVADAAFRPERDQRRIGRCR